MNAILFAMLVVIRCQTVTSAAFRTEYEWDSSNVYAAANAIDGDHNTVAISGDASPAGQWLRIELGQSHVGPFTVRVVIDESNSYVVDWLQGMNVMLANSTGEGARCVLAARYAWNCIQLPRNLLRYLKLEIAPTTSHAWMVIQEVEIEWHSQPSMQSAIVPSYSTQIQSIGRFADLHVPQRLANESLPVVVFLHPFTWTGERWYLHYGLTTDGPIPAIHIVPLGSLNSGGYNFWNATDACCNLDHTDVDDVAYIEGLVRVAIRDYGADPDNVTVVGHSNGAFMVHRLLCELPAMFAAGVAINGATWYNEYDCPALRREVGLLPTVLNIHALDDPLISHLGGEVFPSLGRYPSVATATQRWSIASGCSTSQTLSYINIMYSGENTLVLEHLNCTRGNRVIQWDLSSGGHQPNFALGWMNTVLNNVLLSRAQRSRARCA